MRATFPADLTLLDLIIDIWRNLQIMKLLIMYFSSTSHYFIPLWPKYYPQHPVLKQYLKSPQFTCISLARDSCHQI
jgi:hypothetical protein